MEANNYHFTYEGDASSNVEFLLDSLGMSYEQLYALPDTPNPISNASQCMPQAVPQLDTRETAFEFVNQTGFESPPLDLAKRKRRDSMEALQPSKRTNTEGNKPKAKRMSMPRRKVQSTTKEGPRASKATASLEIDDSDASAVVILPSQAAPRKAKKSKKSTKKGDNKKDGNLSDESDTPIKPEPKSGKPWSTQETDQLLNAILGVDSRYWENFQKNPTRVFKRISRRVFNSTRMPDAVKGRYNRLLKTYKAILRLESWTGNGSQDPDIDQRILNARNAAIDLPKELTAKSIDAFKNKERWYSFFESRLLEDPSISREVEHYSGAISDLDDADYDSPNDDDSSSDDSASDATPPPSIFPHKRPDSSTMPPKTPDIKKLPPSKADRSLQTKKHYLPGVPTPAHKPRSKTKAHTTPALDEYLAGTTAVMKAHAEEGGRRMDLLVRRDERQAEAAQRQADIAQRQLLLDEERARNDQLAKKAQECRELLADPAIPQETKLIAQEVLGKYLQSLMAMF